jgi:hypothetical protein
MAWACIAGRSTPVARRGGGSAVLDRCSWLVDGGGDADPAARPFSLSDLTPGQRLARGVCRHLRGHDFATVEELVPAPGLRVDVMALGPRGEIWVVECKSGRADYATDRKWQGYLAWCDRFFWAVDQAFPTDLLPEGTGLILADAYDAEILRVGPEVRLAPARRKALTLHIARQAAGRLQGLRDPGVWRDV